MLGRIFFCSVGVRPPVSLRLEFLGKFRKRQKMRFGQPKTGHSCFFLIQNERLNLKIPSLLIPL